MSNICKDCGGVDSRPVINYTEIIRDGKRVLIPKIESHLMEFLTPDNPLCGCEPENMFRHNRPEEHQ